MAGDSSLRVDQLVLPIATRIQFLLLRGGGYNYWSVPALGVGVVRAPQAVVSVPLVVREKGLYHGFRCELGHGNPEIVPIVVEFVSMREFIRRAAASRFSAG